MTRICWALLLACALAAGLCAAQDNKRLTPDHVKLAEALRDERDQIQIENAKLQAHLAAFNVKVAEALVGFRKDLGAKSTDQFDFDALDFKPAQPQPPQPAQGRGR